MAEPDFRIRAAEGTWVIRAGGAVLGESARALELTEGNLEPVIYFPREDVSTAFLDKSATVTNCPAKGMATHYGIMAKSGLIPDAAWSYENPLPAAQRIAGYIAFYSDKVTLEEV